MDIPVIKRTGTVKSKVVTLGQIRGNVDSVLEGRDGDFKIPQSRRSKPGGANSRATSRHADKNSKRHTQPEVKVSVGDELPGVIKVAPFESNIVVGVEDDISSHQVGDDTFVDLPVTVATEPPRLDTGSVLISFEGPAEDERAPVSIVPTIQAEPILDTVMADDDLHDQVEPEDSDYQPSLHKA